MMRSDLALVGWRIDEVTSIHAVQASTESEIHSNDMTSDHRSGQIQLGNPLFDLVDEAYRVFSYPKPSTLDVCRNCCMDARVEADFFHPSIRDLPQSYVRDWFWADCGPSGVSRATWGYLLPRILEILASGNCVASVGLEVSLRRFDTGNPDNWSKSEWRILDDFQRRFLSLQIAQGTYPLDNVLCMFRLGGWPLADLLDQVAAVPAASLARRLWRDWCKDHAMGREAVWVTSFWESGDNALVHAFYTSSCLHERMEALVLADETDPDLVAQASAVACVIEAEQRPCL